MAALIGYDLGQRPMVVKNPALTGCNVARRVTVDGCDLPHQFAHRTGGLAGRLAAADDLADPVDLT
jgi:hypothetical protein